MNTKSAVTEVELVYYNKRKASERSSVNTAREAYDLLFKSWHMGRIESQEEFKILLLDNHNRCIGVSNLASGSLISCEVDVGLIFATALKARAAKIILAHNHPSGSLEPSYEDRRLTNKCREAGEVLSIDVADHIVITKEGYLSFSDKHLMSSIQ